MKKIGEILIEHNLIDDKQLEHALMYQQEKDIKLGESLIGLGFISELDFISSLIKHEFVKGNDKAYKFGKLKKFISNYLLKEKSFWISFVLYILFCIVFTFFEPYLYRLFIDNIIPARNPDLIFKAGLFYFAIYIVRIIIFNKKDRHALWFSQNIKLKLRDNLFKILSNLPLSFWITQDFGNIVDRFTTKVDNITGFGDSFFQRFIWSILLFLISLFLLFNISIVMSLIVIAINILSLLLPAQIAVRSSKYYEKDAVYYGKMFTFLWECSSSIDDIQANNIHEYRVKEWSKYLGPILENNHNLQKIWTMSFAVKELLNLLVRFVIVFGGTYLAINNKIYSGELIVFYIISATLSFQINILYEFFVGNILSAKPDWNMIEFLLNQVIEKKEIKTSNNDLKKEFKSVSVKDLVFRYGKNIEILKGVNVVFKKGINVIVGESGSGKSTLLNLLLKVYQPDKGNVTIDDIDLKNIDNNDLYKWIGVLSQKSHLFNKNILQNIGLKDIESKIDLSAVKEATKKADIDNLVLSLPKKYNTVLDGSRNISGGEKQRLLIARLHYNECPILLLDEPNRSIGIDSEKELWKCLKKIKKEKIIIMISHNLDFLSNADEIFVMKDGVIAENGSYKKLMSKKKIFSSMVEKKNEKK